MCFCPGTDNLGDGATDRHESLPDSRSVIQTGPRTDNLGDGATDRHESLPDSRSVIQTGLLHFWWRYL